MSGDDALDGGDSDRERRFIEQIVSHLRAMA